MKRFGYRLRRLRRVISSIRPPSRAARLILHIDLPLLVLFSVVWLQETIALRETSPLAAAELYRLLLPAFCASVAVIAFSVFLTEWITVRQGE